MERLEGGAALLRLLAGGLACQAVATAASLGVADALADGPLAGSDVAAACGADADGIDHLLRALATLGVVALEGEGVFSLTGTGQWLRRDHPESVGAWAEVHDRVFLPMWGGLTSSVRAGVPADRLVLGEPLYDWLDARPEERRSWSRAQARSGPGAVSVDWLVDSIDWETVSSVVDVGGGSGEHLAGLLRRFRHLRGTLVDTPAEVDGRCAPSDLADRWGTVGCDFRTGVPAGADVYLLVRVLFNWPDREVLALLAACRNAASAGGAIVAVDQLRWPEQASAGDFNDLNLFAIGGRVRTAGEWRTLARAAGLELEEGRVAVEEPWTVLVMRAAR